VPLMWLPSTSRIAQKPLSAGRIRPIRWSQPAKVRARTERPAVAQSARNAPRYLTEVG